jgi:hypothetical protein
VLSVSLPNLRLSVRIGASADIPIRIESDLLQFAPVTAMTKTAPLRVTAPSHGIPPGWRAAIVGARGMTEMNVSWDTLSIADLRSVSAIDADTVDFDEVCAIGFGTYTSGGAIAFYAPKSLSAYTGARMDIKRRVGGDVEVSLNTTAGTLEIDTTNSAVWIRLGESTLASVDARDYVFDIELIRPGGVDAICSAESVITVCPEVTTTT